jgi:hypothetical protein
MESLLCVWAAERSPVEKIHVSVDLLIDGFG